jgi:DNA polymerase III subunit alpha
MFVHLNVHSNFTMMSGTDSVEEIVQAAAQGADAVALTDTNGLYAAVPFYKAAIAHGVKPILGAELEIEGMRAVVLAKNDLGYRKLCRLVTARQLDDDFPMEHNPHVKQVGRKQIKAAPDLQLSPHEWELRHRLAIEKMAALIEEVNPAGDIFVLSRNGELLKRLQRFMKRGLYAALTNFGDYAGKKHVERLVSLAGKLKIPYVAANPVYFALPENFQLHRLLNAIRTNSTLDTMPANSAAHPECWMKGETQMHHLFSGYPEAIENSVRIAGQCRVKLPLDRVRLPKFAVPDGEPPADYLRKLTYGGARKRYGTVPMEAKRQIEHELGIIDRMGYTPYFLVVWDIARFARKRGIPSVGRGSAANSIVSYCLGLTHVCPLRYGLFFERFLNLERKDCPDVDLDFCWRRRDEVLEYVYQKYGAENTAMICTFNTFGLRSSIRETARVMGLFSDEISKFTKRLPHWGFDNIESVVEKFPECRDLPINDEPWRTIIATARRIEGHPRFLGVHPGGVVVAPEPITNFMPLQYSAKGLVITQFDMHPVEDIGLVKIDLLGQRSLSVIFDVVKKVRQRDGVELDMENLEEGDPDTIKLWKTGHTIGCFQIESPGMRGLLKKLHVDNLEILTAASSLIRPGPAGAGMMKKFINRYNGDEKVEYIHPALKPLLEKTLGVMVYQEDVIKVAHEFAGLTFGQAEGLRKSMSKKRGIEAVAEYERKFIDGAVNNGFSRLAARAVWDQIASFAGYAFCKAHSASYAQLSYQATYLKAHYPAEFMAAVIDNGGGFYHRAVYAAEARRMGLKILPPDINQASQGTTGERDWVMIGLDLVAELTGSSMQSIIENRPYESIQEFCEKTIAGKKETGNLVRCGAFDTLGKSRPQIMWELETIYANGGGKKRTARQGSTLRETPDLFYGFKYIASGNAPDNLSDYTIDEKIQREMETLDMAVSAHPMSVFQRRAQKLGVITAAEVGHFIDHRVKLAGWLTTTRRHTTAKKEPMRFITLEDLTDTVEVVMFPKTYRKWGHIVRSLGPYLVEGRVDNDHGHVTVVADRVMLLSA